jgi:hypothetical protein
MTLPGARAGLYCSRSACVFPPYHLDSDPTTLSKCPAFTLGKLRPEQEGNVQGHATAYVAGVRMTSPSHKAAAIGQGQLGKGWVYMRG